MIWFAVLLLASAEGFKITDHSPSKVSVFAVLLLASAEAFKVTEYCPSKVSVFASSESLMISSYCLYNFFIDQRYNWWFAMLLTI